MKKGQGIKFAVVVFAVVGLFGAVFLTGGIDRFINGNVQTFSLTNDFGQLNCDMWNGIAVTRDSGVKITVDTSRETGFNPFFDTSALSITDGTNTIDLVHIQLWITCQGDFMDEADAVTVGGSVSTMICGDPVSGTTKCLVGDDRNFSGDLRNAQEFVNINLPDQSLPNDTPFKVAEFTFTAQELELEYTADNGKIFLESTMFPDWDFTFNHPTSGVFMATYNSAQQNDGVVAQYGDLRSTTTSNSPDTDFDGDGIDDLQDLCPTQPETFNGFQDLDGCPDTVDNSGTTDTDGDGIVDNDDACDFQAEDGQGLFPFDGCPVSADECPNLQVLFGSQCVPDSDNDGTPDSQDLCPFVAGFSQYNGCPTPNDEEVPPTDGDGDGVFDDVDQCPTVGGFVDATGCPEEDLDGDGIPDNVDSCPSQGGIVDAIGCPIICGDGFTIDIQSKTCVLISLPPPDCLVSPDLAICGGSTPDDSDGDGIPDDIDLCANDPEDFNGIADHDGCPEGDGVQEPVGANPVTEFIENIVGEDVVDDRTIFIILLLMGGLIAIVVIGRFLKKNKR